MSAHSNLIRDFAVDDHPPVRVRERAKLIGGKLAIWSEHDFGTEIELTIPAASAFATSPHRSRRTKRLF